jgi:hypothetical protein
MQRLLLTIGLITYGFIFTGCPTGPTVYLAKQYDIFPLPWVTNVAPNTSIVVSLAEDINLDVINEEYLQLINVERQSSVPGRLTLNHITKTLRFTPDSPLEPITRYQSRISSTVTYQDSSVIQDKGFVWEFITSNTEDTKAPRLTSISPASGAIAVENTNEIVLTFDEPIDPSSVSPENFLVTDIETGHAAMGTYSCSGNQCRFRTENGLLRGHSYRVAVGSSIADAAGNHLGESVTSLFTIKTTD